MLVIRPAGRTVTGSAVHAPEERCACVRMADWLGTVLALGAQQRELTRLFIGQGFVLALIGVACGLAGAAAVTRVLGSLLFGVNPVDPLTYTVVSIGLIAAAIMASYIPALRAMGVDPLEALRAE
jgi:putative ABC transport system permease protein